MVGVAYRFDCLDWVCLWYPPGWLVLLNRHWQHYHCDHDGWSGLELALFLLPGGFYVAWLLRLGRRAPRCEVSGFEPAYQAAFRDEILAPIAKRYFRFELHGAEQLPQAQRAIAAANHAGMGFPWDLLVLAYALDRTGSGPIRPLAGVPLFEHPWMQWWLPPGWTQALGGVPASGDAFEAAVRQPGMVLYAPEGVRGPAKGWRQRYRLQTFHPAAVRLSDRYQVPIVPVACVGSEGLHPWALNWPRAARALGLPFFPLSGGMLALLLFPSLGVWALPARLRYTVLSPQPPAAGAADNARTVRAAAYQRAQQLRARLQAALNELWP